MSQSSEDSLMLVLRGLPEYIPTGAPNGAKITNPAHMFRGAQNCTIFEGSVNSYSWKHQLDNYTRIQEDLKRNGTELLVVASANYPAERGRLTCFVSMSEDGKVVWYKYEGYVPGGGQNHIYIKGRKMKLTTFLDMKVEDQDALFRQ